MNFLTNDLIQSFRYSDILSVMTFFPCFCALILLLIPNIRAETIRRVALVGSLSPLPFLYRIFIEYNPSVEGIQLSPPPIPWIPSVNIYYHVGMDGLSIAMILLVSIIVPLIILGSFKWVGPPETYKAGYKTYFALILLEQTGLYGVFTALNFFHWFIFWELSLIPMFFLIKFFGGKDRTHASYQFFIYTFIGSVTMLIGMQFIYLATGSWDFVTLADMAQQHSLNGGESLLITKIKAFANTLGHPFLTKHAVHFIFFLIFLGFAVKVPLWPLHTWLPITYTQAPTAGSILLTALMSKMGIYGFLRILLPLFAPSLAEGASILMWLAVATILFGALAAFAQKDLKTLVAYSSISHLGYCLFGLFAAASVPGSLNAKSLILNGVIIQMFAHGLSAAGLFYFIELIEQRTQTREMMQLGGLRKTVPVLCGFMGIIIFASLGLPCLAGFVGEFMIFQGAFFLAPGFTSLAAFGILLTALYLLKMLCQICFGPRDEKWSNLADLNFQERFISTVFVILLFGVGLAPQPLINLSNAAVIQLAKFL